MTVPKASVNKYYGLEPAEHYIRASGKFFIVQTIAQPDTVKITTHKHFRLSVIALHCSHTARPLFGCHGVCHIEITTENSIILDGFDQGHVSVLDEAD